jgi:hypothetical protein
MPVEECVEKPGERHKRYSRYRKVPALLFKFRVSGVHTIPLNIISFSSRPPEGKEQPAGFDWIQAAGTGRCQLFAG